MPHHSYDDNVFLNCPFDRNYKVLFDAAVFAIFDCGYIARCALEFSDAGEVRIDKIMRIISECRYGIHDICRTELDDATGLPRFNMPLELGLFLGAKRFGSLVQKKKVSLIMDCECYRYRKFISDISGQDIKAHQNDLETIIRTIRDWLRSAGRRTNIPGGAEILRRYTSFREDIPAICRMTRIREDELTFNDYATFVSEWLKRFTEG